MQCELDDKEPHASMSAAPPKCRGLCGVIFIPGEAGCGMPFVGVWVGGGHRKNAEESVKMKEVSLDRGIEVTKRKVWMEGEQRDNA